MGIMLKVLLVFLLGMVLLILGVVKKNRLLKLTSIVAIAISILLYLYIWNGLGYM